MAINVSVSYSQCLCPTDIPPTHVPWNPMGPVYVTIMDDNWKFCEFEVYYCWRTYQDPAPSPWIDVFVCSFTPTANCNENFSLSISKIYKRLGEKIIELNPNNLDWPAPPCPQVYPYYAVKTFGCYDNLDGFPCGGSVYCEYLYEVSLCQGQRIVTQIGLGSIGGNCPFGCSSGCQ